MEPQNRERMARQRDTKLQKKIGLAITAQLWQGRGINPPLLISPL